MKDLYGKLPNINEVLETFYRIPNFSRYVISEQGTVVDTTNLTFVKMHRNDAGYRHCNVYRDDGKRIYMGRHRLVALTFIPETRDTAKLFVNHKNGKPGVDHVSNLEWTTPLENVHHAGQLGLTPKCLPIVVRDVETGKEDIYPSFIDYARISGLSKDAVAYRLKSNGQRIFPEKKQYKLKSSETPWYISSDVNKDLLSCGSTKSVLLRNVLSEEVLYFDKQSDCAAYLNIAVATMSKWLDCENLPVWPGFYQVKRYSDDTEWREIDDPYIELEASTGKRCIVVNRVGSIDMRVYTSIAECAEAKNLLVTTLHWRLKSKGKIIYADGCTYQYYSDFISTSSPSRVTVK